jgi:hypothetical protein
MKKAESMLCQITDRLAILELACMSLGNNDILSVKERKFGVDNYGEILSAFVGETLILTMDYSRELDKKA